MASGYGSVPVRTSRRSWIDQHWALTGIAILLGACVLAAAIFASVLSMLRNSDAAKLAIHKAEASSIVAQTIGVPLKQGWLISGSVNIQGSGGNAELAIPVVGPRGKGTIYTTAVRRQSQWQTTKLEFAKEGEMTTQDLLNVQDDIKLQK